MNLNESAGVQIYEVAYLNEIYEACNEQDRALTDEANKVNAKALVLLGENEDGLRYCLIRQDQSISSLLGALAGALDDFSGFSIEVSGSDSFKEMFDADLEEALVIGKELRAKFKARGVLQ